MVYIDSNQLGWEPVVHTWNYLFKEKTLGLDEETILANTNLIAI